MAKLIENVEELEALPEGTVVWQELRKALRYKWADNDYGGSGVPVAFGEPKVSPLVMAYGILANDREYLLPSEYDAADYIRMIVRIWDSKPTQEETLNTPWPTKEECESHW